MSVRELTSTEDLLECGRIQNIAFVSLWDPEKSRRELEKPDARRNPVFGNFNAEGRLTACMCFPFYQVAYEGGTVSMAGVGGVASLPECRQGGAVREIFQAALPWMRKQGAVFSALYPFSHRYYRQFGYELCQMPVQQQVPAEALKGLSCTCRVRMVMPGEDFAPLSSIYQSWLGRCNFAVQRDRRLWEQLVGSDPLRERRYTYLFEDDGGPLAYLVFTVQDDAPHAKGGVVRELAFARPQGLTQVLGFLYRLAAQYKWFRFTLPEHVPLAALLPESFESQAAFGEQPMARLVNVEQALAHKPAPGASYTVAVHDPLLPENDVVFRVAAENGRTTAVRQTGKAADLTLDIGTLTQLCLGSLSLDEAMFKPGVILAGNEQVLRQAFPHRPVFLNEGF